MFDATNSTKPIQFLVCFICFILISSAGMSQSPPSCNGIPYNIDVNCDSIINQNDLLAFLPYWGNEFIVEYDSLHLDLEYAEGFLFLLTNTGLVIDSVNLEFADGFSAYEIWLNQGNTGTIEEFLDSLIGTDGQPGANGQPGLDGQDGAPGAPGAPGANGASAYEIWVSLGNEGSEEDFIASLAGNAAFAPSIHGVFDSESHGTTFVIDHAISTLSIELWGASGGDGGDICGSMPGASDCSLCNAEGGTGGRAIKMVSMIYNLANGDTLELISSAAGDAGTLVSCEVGTTGWVNWDCGPASDGISAESTQLLLNGVPIAEISGGTAGTGACIGCQGDGCFEGEAGEEGTLDATAAWMTVISTETLEDPTGSRLILRY